MPQRVSLRLSRVDKQFPFGYRHEEPPRSSCSSARMLAAAPCAVGPSTVRRDAARNRGPHARLHHESLNLSESPPQGSRLPADQGHRATGSACGPDCIKQRVRAGEPGEPRSAMSRAILIPRRPDWIGWGPLRTSGPGLRLQRRRRRRARWFGRCTCLRHAHGGPGV